MEKMGNIFIFMGIFLIFLILVVIFFGIFLVVNKNLIISKVLFVFNYIGVFIFFFWIGMIFILIFLVKFNIFLLGGMYIIGNDSIGDLVKYLVLFVIILGLYNIVIFINYVEVSVNE